MAHFCNVFSSLEKDASLAVRAKRSPGAGPSADRSHNG